MKGKVMTKIKTATYGYPRIGQNRELKFALEAFWQKKIDEKELLSKAIEVHAKRLKKQENIDLINGNDLSLYDPMLDHALLFNAIPERFKNLEGELERYFAMARGNQEGIACEMTKWFDTNYHYLVVELSSSLSVNEKILDCWTSNHASELVGKETGCYLIGPYTFLKLSKIYEAGQMSDVPAELSNYWKSQVKKVYTQVLIKMKEKGIKRVQIDEPAFVLDLSEDQKQVIVSLYNEIMSESEGIDVDVMTYYEKVSQYQDIVFKLPVSGIGLDLSDSQKRADFLKKGFPQDKRLLAGIVSARNPWKSHLEELAQFCQEVQKKGLGKELVITHAGPLAHLPHTIEEERGFLEDELLDQIAFSDERITELLALADHLNNGTEISEKDKKGFVNICSNPTIAQKAKDIVTQDISRSVAFEKRYPVQMKRFNLSQFPTTTIGSFPQNAEIRSQRSLFNKKEITQEQYNLFLDQVLKETIDFQEEIGLDVLVHGEAERTDMVEYFAQKLTGVACTRNGWVQSYGSRCTRPPLIYGDVSLSENMTVDTMKKAQSMTSKVVKGMLTGPVTIVSWSFYRQDIPKDQVAYQIALALAKEVYSLEENGIEMIQIDEPAFREGLPLKRADQTHYLDWAVKSFRLTHNQVKETTQIHTHMCYSEFNEIIEAIQAMDADVISIEASRSQGDILRVFQSFTYQRGIGLGVYDIHSPRTPSVEEMKDILEKSKHYIDPSLLWVNPDCGLKTRKQEEVEKSLKGMVKAAQLIRKVPV